MFKNYADKILLENLLLNHLKQTFDFKSSP